MEIELHEITADNYMECICLSVSDSQRRHVYSNSFSLAQAHYEKDYYPFAIYADNKMAGFVMYGFDPDVNSWALIRIMVDQRFQNKGIGSQAVYLLFEIIRQKIGNTELSVRVDNDNEPAINFYSKFGFIENGLIEKIMKLHLRQTL